MKAVILDQEYPLSPNVFDGGEGENAQESKFVIETLQVCLKKLPNYYIWGKSLEWGDYFYKCKIIPDSEKDEIYAVNPLYIIINVTSDKLFEVLDKAKELLKNKIRELGGEVDE
ncbi:MAG: hypothetical protein QW478_13755 [Candidatus Micrarchaeaceae archaeon]